MLKVFKTFDPSDTEGWLKARLSGIGGSDAAAVMGDDEWRGPFDVWRDRVYPEFTNREYNEAAYWGTVLEDAVAQEFSKRTGMCIKATPAIYQNSEVPHMLATVDRLILDCSTREPYSLLEVKTRSSFTAKKWDNGVPKKVWWQVQHYLAVTGFEHAYVAALFGGQNMAYFKVDRDEQAIYDLIAKCTELWCMVEAKIQPEVTGSIETLDRLDRIEAVPEKMVELPDTRLVDIARHLTIKEQIKALEKELKDVDARIKADMGDAEVGTIADLSMVRWSTVTQNRVDTKRLQAELPELAAKYTNTSTYRKLTVQGADD